MSLRVYLDSVSARDIRKHENNMQHTLFTHFNIRIYRSMVYEGDVFVVLGGFGGGRGQNGGRRIGDTQLWMRPPKDGNPPRRCLATKKRNEANRLRRKSEHRNVCMYVCMVITYSRVCINRVRLTILLVVS